MSEKRKPEPGEWWFVLLPYATGTSGSRVVPALVGWNHEAFALEPRGAINIDVLCRAWPDGQIVWIKPVEMPSPY